jgi:hypothetical protein
MRIFSTALLTAIALGLTVNDGWCPEPADTKSYINTNATSYSAVAVGPGRNKRMDLGKPYQAGIGLQNKSYTSNRAMTGRTPASSTGNVHGMKPPSAPQVSMRLGRPAPQPR